MAHLIFLYSKYLRKKSILTKSDVESFIRNCTRDLFFFFRFSRINNFFIDPASKNRSYKVTIRTHFLSNVRRVHISTEPVEMTKKCVSQLYNIIARRRRSSVPLRCTYIRAITETRTIKKKKKMIVVLLSYYIKLDKISECIRRTCQTVLQAIYSLNNSTQQHGLATFGFRRNCIRKKVFKTLLFSITFFFFLLVKKYL